MIFNKRSISLWLVRAFLAMAIFTLQACSETGTEKRISTEGIPKSFTEAPTPDPYLETLAGPLSPSGFEDGPADLARFGFPIGVECDGDNIYVSDIENHTIRKFDPLISKVETIAGQSPSMGFKDGKGLEALFLYPRGMVLLNNKLYIGDRNKNVIRILDLETRDVTSLKLIAPDRPEGYIIRGLDFWGDKLIAIDFAHHVVITVDIDSGETQELVGSYGKSGYKDGTGDEALMSAPEGIHVDNDMAYVADTKNHAIRALDLQNLSLETVFGGPAKVDPLDRDQSEASQITGPTHILVSGKDLYFTEWESNAIRKLSLDTRSVETFAGDMILPGTHDGHGSSARFHMPKGLAVCNERLYVIDHLGSSLREVDLTTREVTTIAGRNRSVGYREGKGEEVLIRTAMGLVEHEGLIYFSDNENHVIRTYDPVTQTVSLFAGTPEKNGFVDGANPMFSKPSGLIIINEQIFVADTGNHAIRAINLETAEVSTVVGGPGKKGFQDGNATNAKLNKPFGLALLGDRLFFTDIANHIVRELDVETGIVKTVAGTPKKSGSSDGMLQDSYFNSPYGITAGEEKLYVVDQANHTVRVIDLDTQNTTTLAGKAGMPLVVKDGVGPSARFYLAYDISYRDGKLWVLDTWGSAIRTVDVKTGEVNTVFGNTIDDNTDGSHWDLDGPLSQATSVLPYSLLWSGDDLYLGSLFNLRVIRNWK